MNRSASSNRKLGTPGVSAIIRCVKYFLGIDGGGSRTTCALGDRDRILATAEAGPSNILRIGEETARTNLLAAIGAACEKAGAAPSEIRATCAGIAGAARPDVAQSIRTILASTVSGEIEVVGDVVIMHEAALAGQAGVVVISGTGSIAYGRNDSGETARAGGWGHAISDEGSGHWIGVQAVSAVARSFDGRGSTQLQQRILRRWDLADLDALVQRANAEPAPDFAGLAPEVVAVAGDGDRFATVILTGAAMELASLAESVSRKLWTSGAPRIAMSGGVFANSTLLQEFFRDEMGTRIPDAEVVWFSSRAAEGAVGRARRAIGAF